MNYNDGKPHNDFYDKNEKEKEKIATQFSEGNNQLKELLLNLWKREIKTIACCIGHENKKVSYDNDEGYISLTTTGYISLIIDDYSLSYLNSLFELIQNLGIDEIKISIDNYLENSDCSRFSIYFPAKFSTFVFSKMNQLLMNGEIYSQHSTIESLLKLTGFATQNGCDFECNLSNWECEIAIYNDTLVEGLDANEIHKNLEDLTFILEKNNGKIPIPLFAKSDIESLKRILDGNNTKKNIHK